ncbi:hypothetical protein BH09DEP1_BH09DEP1_0980 [soil metagenome]
MKKILIVLLTLLVSHEYALEHRVGMLTRAQLRAQEQQEQDKRVRNSHEQDARDGIHTILKYAPMCTIGAGLYLNSLYRLHNFEDKCWVQPLPTVTPEMGNLLMQLCCGAVLCLVPSGCFGDGCNDLCRSQICNEDNCCSKCCTLCTQECCNLLGMHRKT